MYVASVTPDPAGMIREMKRVTKESGRIFIVNHFSRKGSLMSVIEKALTPFARIIGFEPLFYLDDFLATIDLSNVRVHPVFPFGYWLVLEFSNTK